MKTKFFDHRKHFGISMFVITRVSRINYMGSCDIILSQSIFTHSLIFIYMPSKEI